MNMKDILARLVAFSGKTRNTVDPINKESIEKLIDIAISNHRSFFEPMLRLAPKEFNDIQVLYAEIADPKFGVIKSYQQRLTGKAVNYERKHFLHSLIYANQRFSKELKNIRMKLDKVIDTDQLTLEECKISNMSLMGVLRQSDILSHWSIYLWQHICVVTSRASMIVPKYRIQHLETHGAAAAEIVVNLCEEKFPANFVAETEKLQKNLSDANVFTSDNKVNMSLSAMNAGYMKGFFGSLGVLINMLNIFRWPVEVWDEYLYRKNLENVELKNWMEQHVALMRLELMRVPQDDPKYYKLQKTIEAYDNKIIEYAEKISKYEQEG